MAIVSLLRKYTFVQALDTEVSLNLINSRNVFMFHNKMLVGTPAGCTCNCTHSKERNLPEGG